MTPSPWVSGGRGTPSSYPNDLFHYFARVRRLKNYGNQQLPLIRYPYVWVYLNDFFLFAREEGKGLNLFSNPEIFPGSIQYSCIASNRKGGGSERGQRMSSVSILKGCTETLPVYMWIARKDGDRTILYPFLLLPIHNRKWSLRSSPIPIPFFIHSISYRKSQQTIRNVSSI